MVITGTAVLVPDVVVLVLSSIAIGSPPVVVDEVATEVEVSVLVAVEVSTPLQVCVCGVL